MMLTVFRKISGNVINPNPQCLIVLKVLLGKLTIAKFWRDHYGSLLNSSLNTTSKSLFMTVLDIYCFSDGMLVSVNEVLKLVDNLEIGVGMDGLNGEYMKNADIILSVLLSFCFTNMLKHSYLPSAMLDSVTIPLVTNKCGDLSDKNYYRPILQSLVLYQKSSKTLSYTGLKIIYEQLITSLGSKHIILLINVFMR